MKRWNYIGGCGVCLHVAAAALVIAAVGCASETGGTQNPVGGGGVLAPTAGTGTAGTGGVAGGAPIGSTPIAPGPGAGMTPVAPAMDGLPCEIETIIQSGCHTCHGAMPIGGAPMPLLSLADFQRDYTVVTTAQLSGQTMKMHEIVRIRVNAEMGTGRMPQGAPLAEADLATLNAWLASGAPAGAACGSTGPATGGQAGAGGMAAAGAGGSAAGSGGTDANDGDGECDSAEAFEPLVAQGDETCYDFQVHGVSSPSDTSKFRIPTGESYSQFYYDVPWQPGTLATRFGSDFDNLPVLHHWLAFASSSGNPDGTVTPNVIGTTAGENAELVAGWAVGGCNTVFPDDVGVRLPSSGKIMVQWHHYNHTNAPQMDGSKVQICTVPPGARPNEAGLTFLGTENFNGPIGMPPGMHDFGGTCLNDSGAPITILGFTPHMHTIGIHMKSEVMRAAGGTEVVFDKPFQFDYQVNYMMDPPIVLQPGDSIKSTCTFLNDSGGNVAFGQSTGQEMCYQFALAYPYGALNNGVPSLIAATNTCW